MTRRCENCKKKVNLVSFECKCKFETLCINCKLPEHHFCGAIEDFKKKAKEILNKNNPIIIADKLIKI